MTDTTAETAETAARQPTHTRRGIRPWRWAPALTLILLLGPVAAGLIGTLGPALGLHPTLGGARPTLGPIRDLLAWPGLPGAVGLSLWVGAASTLLSLGIVILIVAGWHGTPALARVERLLSPLLSVPHAAAALGLAFLIAPSGWIARVASPGLTGWDRPPDLLIPGDPAGLALILGLLTKEVPFLMLMTLAALPQTDATARMRVAQALGYGRVTGWLKTVLPAVYRQIRLPVYAVLAYSMATVDMALILGPTTPAPLAVHVVAWMHDPDLAMRLQAAAGAALQLLLVLVALALWRGGEIAAERGSTRWRLRGGRGSPRVDRIARAGALGLGVTLAAALVIGLVGLAVWSVAGLWAFPDALPDALTLRSWARAAPTLTGPLADTLLIAGLAALISLTLVIACLEAEHRTGQRPTDAARWLLYLPLILPQVAFLTGLQTLAITVGLDGGRLAVILAHIVFVLPYVFLSLSEPWRAWDTRQATVAHALGAGPGRVLWAVRLPMLVQPVLTALAVGFAVSVGQYLPTLLIGAGRIETLTTEAVALSSGGDRRIVGVYALMQFVVLVIPFAAATLIPKLLTRGRVRHG